MKRLRFLTGNAITETGNFSAIVPPSQVLSVSMVPGSTGSWIQINETGPIWVPPDVTLDLDAEEFGRCCGEVPCDQWPGEVQVAVVFGQGVTGLDPRTPLGSIPDSWLIIFNGC